MKKRQGLMLITAAILFMTGLALHAQSEEAAAPTAPAATVPVEPVQTGPSAEALKLEEARKLLERGTLIEAHIAFEEVIGSEGIDAKTLAEAQSGLEALNMKILFSKTETPSSEIYEVQPGDSLYKIAKKYGTTIALIKKSNGLEGDTIYPDMPLKVEKGTFTIHVDKSENLLALKLNGKVLRHYRVATGRDNGTPVGDFKIKTKLVDPVWYTTGAVVPPDSEQNILGTRWMGFDMPGYGIHGTTIPESIGTQATAGCVRMLNHEVEELYGIVPRGTQVTVID